MENKTAKINRRKDRKKSTIIVITILGIGFLALAAGAAHAAMKSIQLNSSATFPVDI